MTNAYDSSRGNPTDRQRRKLYLLETYRADVQMLRYAWPDGDLTFYPANPNPRYDPVNSGAIPLLPIVTRVPACRCYRCGKLLAYETLTVDRIVPGCKGGTYRRSNIRPSCSDCATKTGNDLKAAMR